MSIGSRVVLAVTFQKVDAAPYAQAAAQGDDQSLQNVDSVSKKAHIHSSFRSVEFLERQIGIGHSSFSSGVSSFGLELIFETIIPVQVTTTTQRYIPIPNAHVR